MTKRLGFTRTSSRIKLLPHEHRRNDDPDTSHAAAKRLGSPQKALVRRLLAEYLNGDWTAEEAADNLGLDSSSGYWKRVSDLKNHKFIEDTGIRRAGSTGRAQAVLRITQAGIDEIT